MKRFILFLLFVFQFSLFQIFATSEATQFVLPKNLYVGDTAEIRYVFRSDVNLLSDDLEIASSQINLITDFRAFNKMSSKCLVKKASLSRIGTEYTLVLEVVVWTAEKIDFPPFDLGALIHFSKEDTSSPVFWVDIEPLEVASIAQKNEITTFLPQKSPVLLPGTFAILVVLCIFFLILFCVLIFSLIHIPTIADFIEKFLISSSMKRNSRVAVKKLWKLQKKSTSLEDCEFALQFQLILKEFLSLHLDEDFSSSTTFDFSVAFRRIFLDDIPIEFERFIDIFSRTDYIRFARGQVDSSFQKTQEFDERKNLLEEVIFTISALGKEISVSGGNK